MTAAEFHHAADDDSVSQDDVAAMAAAPYEKSPHDQLEEMMSELGITVEVKFEDETTDEDGWQHRAYRFALYVGSYDEAGFVLSNAPYRAGMACDEPTPVDVFGSVLMDSLSVSYYDCGELAEDWFDWAADMGGFESAETARKAFRDFREIQARSSLIEERIGHDAFKSLLAIAAEL